MSTLLAIAHVEFRLQRRRSALWLALLVGGGLALWEVFPSAHNMARLSGLGNTAYAAMRLYYLAMPLLGLAAGILAADRLARDEKIGMALLLWTTPHMHPLAYVLGKFLGSYGALCILPIALGVAGLVQRWLFMPAPLNPPVYLTALIWLGLVPLAFIVALSLATGRLVGARLTNLALIVYLLWSSGFPSAGPDGVTQIYRFVGNATSLLYTEPNWPNTEAQVVAGWYSIGFCLACTLAALAALALVYWVQRPAGGSR